MFRVLALVIFTGIPAYSQIALQESHTTAGLRGIHSLGGGVAWASGTAGTVLRTVDSGKTWQRCAIPPDADKLDFRAVQAFDDRNALVMSAGPGDLSRVYKTSDACRTWKLVLSNSDPQGFWDAMKFRGPGPGALIADPVDGAFPLFVTEDGGNTWRKPSARGVRPEQKDQAFFAASNASMLIEIGRLLLLTGGGTASLVSTDLALAAPPVYTPLPLAKGEAAGGFAMALRTDGATPILVVVGGDYKAPGQTTGTAAVCTGDIRRPLTCKAATEPPRGYRSTVAYDPGTKTWISAGTNGADISTDDGRTWRAFDDSNWNAISFPFVVGPNGRIGLIALPR